MSNWFGVQLDQKIFNTNWRVGFPIGVSKSNWNRTKSIWKHRSPIGCPLPFGYTVVTPPLKLIYLSMNYKIIHFQPEQYVQGT